MSKFRILEWDSEFFGFTVARILSDKLTLQELETNLRNMKEKNVSLVYWDSDPDDLASQEAARSCDGFLANKKLTFVINAKDIRERLTDEVSNIRVEEYINVLPTIELENLAIQAGTFSRFKVDPRISQSRFEALYRLWVRNSVSKEIADVLLVVRNSGKIAGMVTAVIKGDHADIGLIAVNDSFRGRGIGLSLIQAVHKWALRKQLNAAQVVTQGENIIACRLYEKCGYRVDKIENIYHFWI